MKKWFSQAIDTEKLQLQKEVRETTRILFDDLNPTWHEWFVMDEDKEILEVFLLFGEEIVIYIGDIRTYIPKENNQYKKLEFKVHTEYFNRRILGIEVKANTFKSTMYFREYNMLEGDALNIECSVDVYTS